MSEMDEMSDQGEETGKAYAQWVEEEAESIDAESDGGGLFNFEKIRQREWYARQILVSLMDDFPQGLTAEGSLIPGGSMLPEGPAVNEEWQLEQSERDGLSVPFPAFWQASTRRAWEAWAKAMETPLYAPAGPSRLWMRPGETVETAWWSMVCQQILDPQPFVFGTEENRARWAMMLRDFPKNQGLIEAFRELLGDEQLAQSPE